MSTVSRVNTIYTLPGKPVPLQRPRYCKDKIYDNQKREKSNASIYLIQQHNDAPLFEGALKLTAFFYFETPKKTKSLNRKPHQSRPDLDNLVKYICDISNGIIYRDDAQIAHIVAYKLYDTIPRSEFTLDQL